MSTANRGRGKYRFNIIDVLLILVIVMSLASMAFLYFYDGSGGDEDDSKLVTEIIYTVEQSALPDILRGKINMGDSVISDDGEAYIGQVIDIEYTDAKYKGLDSNGNAFEELYPGRINVRVRISAEAVVDENGFYVVNGRTISVGKEYGLRFPYYTGEAVCVSVSEVSE